MENKKLPHRGFLASALVMQVPPMVSKNTDAFHPTPARWRHALTTSLCLFLFLLLRGQDTKIHYLSGTDALTTIQWDFYCTAGMNSGYWTTIGVPSCWEQEGFGSYNYGHDAFKDRLNEERMYKHRFEVPADWKGSQIQLVFEGVMTDASVKVNGKAAGPVHQGSFYEFKYDIGPCLLTGEKTYWKSM